MRVREREAEERKIYFSSQKLRCEGHSKDLDPLFLLTPFIYTN
jgi:hypothetical protein